MRCPSWKRLIVGATAAALAVVTSERILAARTSGGSFLLSEVSLLAVGETKRMTKATNSNVPSIRLGPPVQVPTATLTKNTAGTHRNPHVAPAPRWTPSHPSSAPSRRPLQQRKAQQLPSTSSTEGPTTASTPVGNTSSAPPTSSILPSLSPRPSLAPSQLPSARPSLNGPTAVPVPTASDSPSNVPSPSPSITPPPSFIPSAAPSITYRRRTIPFLEMTLTGVDRNWTNRDVTTFQLVTNEFVTFFWNNIENSPVRVGRTVTNVIPGQVARLPLPGREDEGGGGRSEPSVEPPHSGSSDDMNANNTTATANTDSARGSKYLPGTVPFFEDDGPANPPVPPPPTAASDRKMASGEAGTADTSGSSGTRTNDQINFDARQETDSVPSSTSPGDMGPLRLGYNQTISFELLPPFVLNPVSDELFLMPFAIRPNEFAALLAIATNNTGIITVADLRIADLPTPSPSSSPLPVPGVVGQNDRDIIIITVVIAVTSLFMAAAYILYQGRKEQHDGLVSLDDSVSYAEEDLHRQSVTATRSALNAFARDGGVPTVKSSAQEASEAAAAAAPAAAGGAAEASPAVAVGTMGAVTAVTAATAALSDLASAAVSAVQGLVVAATPPLRFDSVVHHPPLEEILEADESRTLSPSVHTAEMGGDPAASATEASDAAGPDSALLQGSAMGSAVAGCGFVASGISAVVNAVGPGMTDLPDVGRGYDPSSQHQQPRYPTYSSLPISVISDEQLDLSPHHAHHPSSLTSASLTVTSLGGGVGGGVAAEAPSSDLYYPGAGGAPLDLPLLPAATGPSAVPPPVGVGGVPIVTDLSLSTVMNQGEMMIDVPVSPLAMMGFQLEIQDLDDYDDGNSSVNGGKDRGSSYGGASSRQ